ncbi:Ig-like domain-containing protein [Lacticaseibacillus paracasei]|nr:Ig-like domain-containing protein [Lacticaseibacillus paracasei]
MSGVSLTPATVSVKVGATTALTATVSPEDATDKAVSYASSKTSVATINSSGVLTGVSEGSTTITVTTHDGGKTASAAVTVTAV